MFRIKIFIDRSFVIILLMLFSQVSCSWIKKAENLFNTSTGYQDSSTQNSIPMDSSHDKNLDADHSKNKTNVSVPNQQAKNISSLIHIPITKYKLSNGLTVILNPDKEATLVSYKMGVSVGGRHEPAGLTGISHMFEHLMFKGSAKYPKSINHYYQINGVININAYTSSDYTVYQMTLPPDQMEFVFDVEFDRMTNLILTKKKLDVERGAIQEERKIRFENNPNGAMWLNFIKSVFTKHPYKQGVIGSIKDIAGYTLEDLKSWYKTYYSPNNSTLVLSGNFSENKAKKLIQQYFGDWQAQNIKTEVVIKEPIQTQAKYVRLQKDVQSSTIVIAFKCGALGTKEQLAMEVIAALLGQGESSPLYKSLVRETNLASSAGSHIVGFLQEILFIIEAKPFNKNNEQKIKTVVQQQLQIIRENFVTKKDLEKVKNIKINEFVTSLMTTESRSQLFVTNEMNFHDYSRAYTQIDDLNTLTPEYIQQVAKKFLNQKQMTYFIMEPKK